MQSFHFTHSEEWNETKRNEKKNKLTRKSRNSRGYWTTENRIMVHYWLIDLLIDPHPQVCKQEANARYAHSILHSSCILTHTHTYTGIRKFVSNRREIDRGNCCAIEKCRCTKSGWKLAFSKVNDTKKVAFCFRNHRRRTRSIEIQNPKYIVLIKRSAAVVISRMHVVVHTLHEEEKWARNHFITNKFHLTKIATVRCSGDGFLVLRISRAFIIPSNTFTIVTIVRLTDC